MLIKDVINNIQDYVEEVVKDAMNTREATLSLKLERMGFQICDQCWTTVEQPYVDCGCKFLRFCLKPEQRNNKKEVK